MSRRPVILIGGGEHARVVADAIRSKLDSFDLIGFVDPNTDPTLASRLRAPRLGDDTALMRYPDALAVVAFGVSRPVSGRREAVQRVGPVIGGWATVVHRDARVAPDAVIGEGTVVLEGAVVQVGAHIGAHCVINAMVGLGHDVAIGDNVLVSPGVVIGGGVSIGEGAFLGLGAIIRDHCTVGTEAFVGMGSVVVSNVASGARVLPRVALPTRSEWKSS